MSNTIDEKNTCQFQKLSDKNLASKFVSQIIIMPGDKYHNDNDIMKSMDKTSTNGLDTRLREIKYCNSECSQGSASSEKITDLMPGEVAEKKESNKFSISSDANENWQKLNVYNAKNSVSEGNRHERQNPLPIFCNPSINGTNTKEQTVSQRGPKMRVSKRLSPLEWQCKELEVKRERMKLQLHKDTINFQKKRDNAKKKAPNMKACLADYKVAYPMYSKHAIDNKFHISSNPNTEFKTSTIKVSKPSLDVLPALQFSAKKEQSKEQHQNSSSLLTTIHNGDDNAFSLSLQSYNSVTNQEAVTSETQPTMKNITHFDKTGICNATTSNNFQNNLYKNTSTKFNYKTIKLISPLPNKPKKSTRAYKRSENFSKVTTRSQKLKAIYSKKEIQTPIFRDQTLATATENKQLHKPHMNINIKTPIVSMKAKDKSELQQEPFNVKKNQNTNNIERPPKQLISPLPNIPKQSTRGIKPSENISKVTTRSQKLKATSSEKENETPILSDQTLSTATEAKQLHEPHINIEVKTPTVSMKVKNKSELQQEPVVNVNENQNTNSTETPSKQLNLPKPDSNLKEVIVDTPASTKQVSSPTQAVAVDEAGQRNVGDNANDHIIEQNPSDKEMLAENLLLDDADEYFDVCEECEIVSSEKMSIQYFFSVVYNGPDEQPKSAPISNNLNKFHLIVKFHENDSHIWRVNSGVCLYSAAPQVSQQLTTASILGQAAIERATCNTPKKRKIDEVVALADGNSPSHNCSFRVPNATSTPCSIRNGKKRVNRNEYQYGNSGKKVTMEQQSSPSKKRTQKKNCHDTAEYKCNGEVWYSYRGQSE